MKDIPDKSIDLILCDLPYGTTQNKWDVILPFDKLWAQYTRVSKENAAVILFGSGLFTAKLILSNEKNWRYNLVWDKDSTTGFLNSAKMPLRQHEDIIVFYQSPPKYFPQKTRSSKPLHSRGMKQMTNNNYGEFKTENKILPINYKHPTSIIKIKSVNTNDRVHPTIKPSSLFEYLIRTYSSESDIVLDNCAGSCTTAIACIKTGRNFICIEKEPEYCKIGEKRIAALPNTKLQDWFE